MFKYEKWWLGLAKFGFMYVKFCRENRQIDNIVFFDFIVTFMETKHNIFLNME